MNYKNNTQHPFMKDNIALACSFSKYNVQVRSNAKQQDTVFYNQGRKEGWMNEPGKINLTSGGICR